MNQLNTGGGGGGGAYTVPRGPADDVVDALNVFAAALKRARAAGWGVQVTLDNDEITVECHKTLTVLTSHNSVQNR